MSSELSGGGTGVPTPPSPHDHSPQSITPLTTTTDWRPYTFEHPLTAATSAMLNISGGGNEELPGSGFGILYDYHYGKIGTEFLKDKTGGADIWSPVVVTTNGLNGKLSNGDMPEVFLPSPLQPTSSKLSSVLRRAPPPPENSKIPKMGHRYLNGGPSDPSPPPSNIILVKEESGAGSPGRGLGPNNDDGAVYGSPQLFATLSNSHNYDFGPTSNIILSSAAFSGGGNLRGAAPGYAPSSPGGPEVSPYYRIDYFGNDFGASGVGNNGGAAQRQLSPYDGCSAVETNGGFVERYVRQSGYKAHGLPIDLPSPDSGIGAEAITPRDQNNIQQGFDYNELCSAGLMTELGQTANGRASSPGSNSQSSTQKSSRPWHDFGRQNEADKIQIPKLFSNYGFRYYLESPISTSQRREDDRITYINKGQFYGISLEYVPDPEKGIKSQTVKTVVMLVFREEKSPEDEIKAWQFWHGRQHSVKQRILDADTKNSVGLVGCIDEIAHNAIAIYWNPMESSAKINVAVQCLSTDFSSQKGVKGLPLHLQIDTYDDPRDPNCPISHRGYCQIKVFCDKGAERKTRDEERRAAKRKLTTTGRKRLDEMYHLSTERSEFYSMSELTKPPVLFTPAEDIDKLTSLELHGFYSTNSEGSDHSGGRLGLGSETPRSCGSPNLAPPHPNGLINLQNSNTQHFTHVHQPSPTLLKFHHNFPSHPPQTQGQQLKSDKGLKSENSSGESLSVSVSETENSVGFSISPPGPKKPRLVPPPTSRLMIYVRQDRREPFTPLHLVPPTTLGLLSALEEKYKISMGSVKNLFRRNSKGIVAKVDDEMLKHYCHEDSFLLDVKASENDDAFDITLAEDHSS